MEQSYVLNRSVSFTEIPGSPKIPSGSKISYKPSTVPGEFEVVLITPQGQTHTFKSHFIHRLVQTPWVNTAEGAAITTANIATQVEPEPDSPNPFTIGDVASVESGIQSDALKPLDVTGSSSISDTSKPLDVTGNNNISDTPKPDAESAGDTHVEETESEATSISDETLVASDVTGSSSDVVKKTKTSRSKKS